MKENNQFNNIEISVINESWLSIYARKKSELQLGQDSHRPRMLITVFGGNITDKDSTTWDKCFHFGQEVAKRGGIIINGGYGGVMEASAAGARSRGGDTIGVSAENLPEKEVNPYIVHEWKLKRWDQRLLTLVWLADGYAVMPGSSGTLVELSMVIETQFKGFIPARPVVCLGSFWKPVVSRIEGAERMVRFARTPIKCAEMLFE